MENKPNRDAFPKHEGSDELIEKYNINDQAHSDSSKNDFIKTVSEFHHADESLIEAKKKENELNRKL